MNLRHTSPTAAAHPLDPIAVLAVRISHASTAHLLPEVSLVAAILEDAVNCIQKNVYARHGRGRKDFLEAYRWVFGSEHDWPFAFENVCDILGLNAAAVRASVGRLLPAPKAAVADAVPSWRN